MFDSRRFQYCVLAALQPISNHIHRAADYPVDTPAVNSTGEVVAPIAETRTAEL
jgi:hypothetical protein